MTKRMNNEILYIIDGHAQIYRAYYAVSGLTGPSGEPTNATFGFMSMFLKLLDNCRPTHIALAMDAGSSQRDQLDPQYKAQRRPMPEDMPAQIRRISQMMEAVGVPILRVEGYEADDVIATVVNRIKTAADFPHAKVYVCSRDKDMDALIDERTVLFDIQENAVLDAVGLLAKKGYRPEQAADVLALTGDTVDNIPGVPGVGPKTAAKWIAQFGSLDNLIANAANIPGKAGEALRSNLGVLNQSRQLVRLQTDVPVNFSWSQCRFDPNRLSLLLPMFEELNFRRLIPQLQRATGPALGGPPTENARMAPALVTRQTTRIPTQDLTPAEVSLFNQITKDTAAAPSTDEGSGDAPSPVADPNNTPPVPGKSLHPVQGNYRLVNSIPTLLQMLQEIRDFLGESKRRWLSVDTETDALGAMKSNVCGISVSAVPGQAWYVAIKGPAECVAINILQEYLGPLLADPTIKKIGQNLKYDINVLRRCQLPLAGVYLDTMIADYLLDSSRVSHSMDAMAVDYLGLKPIAISSLLGKGTQQRSFAQVPLEQACTYAAEDADVTLRLAEVLFPRLADAGMDRLFFDVEMPLVSVLADMEYAGVKVDVNLLHSLSADIKKRLTDLKLRIREVAGMEFNFDSPRQLGQVLFGKLGLRVIKKTKTGPSTDISVLEALADDHPVPALILEYRQLTKLQGTYLEPLAAGVSPVTGRVHASFNQTVAETGRLSSSDPNLQNIPIRTDIGREIRRAFIARNSHYVIISADYSQVELRILAHFCHERALIAAFSANHDIHAYVAAQIHHVELPQVTPEMRRVAKSVNFGIIYGQTSYGLAKLLKIPEREAAAFIQAYKARFPAIEEFFNACTQEAMTHGFVQTILGRRRQIPQIHSTNQSIRQFGRRAAINSVIQGSAADLIKVAMVRIHRRIKPHADDIQLILQIHDELVFECVRDKAATYAQMVREEMEHAMDLRVPLKVDVAWGDNWLSAK
jgi:DNA polymerase-1